MSKHSPELQALLDDIRETIQSGCGNKCVIPSELIPHLGHITGAISEIGGKDVETGINTVSDALKRLIKRFRAEESVISKLVVSIAVLLVTGIAGLIWYGLIWRVQHG